MSYTGTAAQTGSQTTFAIIHSASPVTISEILDFSQSGKQNKTADATNLQSTAEEFIATLMSPGKYDLSYNRIAGDAGQGYVLASFNAKTLCAYTITLPETPAQTVVGDVYSFNAIVEELDDISSLSPTKQVTTKASLKVSGAITLTAGH